MQEINYVVSNIKKSNEAGFELEKCFLNED
jgi:hypothetical protein